MKRAAAAILACIACVSCMSAGRVAEGSAAVFQSSVPALDRAYAEAWETVTGNIKGGRFLAGANWRQVWTRDTAYSVDLACGLLQPKVSRTTLLGLREEVPGIGECWPQDACGHFGGWPHLTDAIAGAVGAWSLYRVTGDVPFLARCYRRTVNSLRRADRDAYNSDLGLYGGCSTFMESNSGYPAFFAFKGDRLDGTYALSTNLLYREGWRIAAEMGRILGEDIGSFQERAARLGEAINARLWMPDKGFYAYYLSGDGALNDHMEGAGEAFAVLWGLADEEKAGRILRGAHVTAWGIPCQWPQYAEWMDYSAGDADYYHNGMVWPFVQGYWAWAAARQKDVAVFGRELDAVTALHEAHGGFNEFYRPEDGAPDGSSRQLWSASGFLSMVCHGILGIEAEEGGMRFAPVVPRGVEHATLRGLSYRGSSLEVTVRGNGARVTSFELDGERRDECFLPASPAGIHRVVITVEP